MEGESPTLIIIILNVFQYKMSRFVQFWCKLSTSSIVKTCPFRFPRDYYGDSLDVMFPQLTISYRFPWCLGIFSLVFLQLPRMLLLGVSTTSSDASPWCFYNFLRCFYCFPSVFPPFPIYFRFCGCLIYF